MCHLRALPGDPSYDTHKGINYIVERAERDISVLQNEGINGILISNEFSYPYCQNISQITVATMARVIGELKHKIHVPFGVDCMYDPYATIDLAIATDANYYRLTLSSISATDLELGTTILGRVFRHSSITNAKRLINIEYAIENNMDESYFNRLMKAVIVQLNPDAVCISAKSVLSLLINEHHILSNVKNTVIMCDGGCSEKNIADISEHTNGIIVGTALKENQEIQNPISAQNIRKLLCQVKPSI